MNPLKATALLLFLSLNACDGPRLIVEEGLTLHGQKAREAISEMHIPVPENAKDIYFHSVGWQDPIVFISFSTDPESAEKVVREFAEVGFSDFVPWENQIDKSTPLREPGYFDKKAESDLYDADSFHDAIFYEYRLKTDELHYFIYYFIYDRATQRLYISS